MPTFSWDPQKELRNINKHGLDFSFAPLLWSDRHLVILYDRFEGGEHRYHAVGVVGQTCLVLVHTYPDPDSETEIRVIGYAKRPLGKGSDMKKESLTAEQEAMLAGLDDLPDTSDIPEISEESWTSARRFYKVRKEPISIRLDADILDWLRGRHAKYQVEINRILRERMEAETRV